ncbi:MAG: Slp family lipoprotein [Deltaproteobacteria bacterium]|nr:Slp family lipoprotein [Deltaproteobacteria bacterium]
MDEKKSKKFKRHQSIWVLSVILAILLLQGCTSVISKSMRQEVDLNLTFEQVIKDPDAHTGQMVLFGGTIIRTENVTGQARIFVLQRPLIFRDEPTAKDITMGRFIISVQDFLDPEIYKPGRKVTVAGPLTGKEVHPLDGIEYPYPVIAKKELYLWPIQEYRQESPTFRFGFGVHMGL